MAVVSVAIVLSFHLKREPTDLELRMARPLGAIFWGLSIIALCAGVGNYISKSRSRCMTVTLLFTWTPRNRQQVQQENGHRPDGMENTICKLVRTL